MKFEEAWDKLKAKNSFERQSVTKYLRLTLVFMCTMHHKKSLIAICLDFFASINKAFILRGKLDIRLSFNKV